MFFPGNKLETQNTTTHHPPPTDSTPHANDGYHCTAPNTGKRKESAINTRCDEPPLFSVGQIFPFGSPFCNVPPTYISTPRPPLTHGISSFFAQGPPPLAAINGTQHSETAGGFHAPRPRQAPGKRGKKHGEGRYSVRITPIMTLIHTYTGPTDIRSSR